MIFDDPTTYYAILAGKAFVLILGTIVLLGMWRQTRRVEQLLSELKAAPTPEEQPDSSKQQLIASLRLDKRITELQQQIAALSTTEQKAGVEPVARPLPIENATRMARHGASVEELTRTCGLNVGEAELLKKLHGAPTTSQRH